MSADTRAAFLKLRIQLSKEDVNSALRSVRALQHDYAMLEEATEGVNRGRIQHIRVLNLEMQGYRKLGEEVKRTGTETRKAGDLLKRYQSVKAAVLADQRAGIQAVGSAGRLTSGIGQLSRVAGIGGAGQALGVAADIAELTEELPRLKQAVLGLPDAFKALFGALGVGGVLVSGGLIAVAIALKALSDTSAATRAETERLIQAQLELIRVAVLSTRQQLEEKIKQAEIETKISELSVRQAQESYDAAYQAYINNIDLFKDIPLFDAFAASEKVLQEELVTLNKSRDSLAGLIDLRNDETIAMNTARVAAEELLKALQSFIDLGVNTTISATIAAAKLTEEQAKERLEAIRIETAAIEDGLQQSGQSAENIKTLNDRLAALSIEAGVLNLSMQQIRARDLAADLKELAKIEQEVATLQAEHNDKIADLNQERLDAELKAYQDHADAIAEAIRDANNARTEAERDRDLALAEAARDGAIEREEVERDHQKNLQKIQREFARSREQAIQDRDAVALEAAERKRTEDRQDELDSYKERQRQLEKNLQEENRRINNRYQEQIRNIDMRLSEQVRNIEMRYQQQLQTIAQANARAIQAEIERYQKEYQVKMNAVNTLLGIETQGVKSTLALHTQFWQYAVQLAKNAGLTIASAYSGKPTQLSYTGTGLPGQGIKTPPQLASGGYIQRDGLAYLHAGETVIPARGGRGATLNLNLNGATMKTVEITSKQQALAVVGIALDEMMMAG